MMQNWAASHVAQNHSNDSHLLNCRPQQDHKWLKKKTRSRFPCTAGSFVTTYLSQLSICVDELMGSVAAVEEPGQPVVLYIFAVINEKTVSRGKTCSRMFNACIKTMNMIDG